MIVSPGDRGTAVSLVFDGSVGGGGDIRVLKGVLLFLVSGVGEGRALR